MTNLMLLFLSCCFIFLCMIIFLYLYEKRKGKSKGLKKSIQFIYDIVNEYMTSADEKQPLVFNETGRPFEIELISVFTSIVK